MHAMLYDKLHNLPYFDDSMHNLKFLLDQPIHNYEYIS